ncbi:MAG: peptidylprolyl isomerase [Pseudomonadota bacterium]|nr:peptidylprolyl isomerase [Pseudomonadota bacterium]
MKLAYLTLALGLGGLLAGCDQVPLNAADQSPASTATAVNDTSPVLATVNGSPITEGVVELYEQQLSARRPGNPAGQDRRAILEEVINLELARQGGEKEGLDKDTTVQLQIDQQRRAVIATAAIQHELEANPVSDEELKKIYQEQAPSGDEYKARHILVKEEDEAKTLIVELDNGADFSELAKQHSTGPSGKSGGELGWFSPKQMVAPFSEAVAGMEKGTYTKQPVKTQFGWHIIILDDTREASPPPFEQLKPQLQAFVQKQRVQAYITRLRESATIEIKEQPPAAADQAEPADAASGEDKP